MGTLRQELMQEIQSALDRTRTVGICAVCGAMMQTDEHTCKPDEQADAAMSASWRYLLGDGPDKRAKGYAVR